MSLTGWMLPSLLGLVALVLFVPLIFGLPRRSGKRAALVRVAQLTVFTLVVVSLVGWNVNRTEKLFGTWTDLYRYVSNEAPPATSKQFGGVVTRSAPSPAPTTSPSALAAPVIPDLPPLPSADRLQHLDVTGAQSGLTGKIHLYLPAGYDPKRAQGYPVIVGMYGFPGALRASVRAARWTTCGNSTRRWRPKRWPPRSSSCRNCTGTASTANA